MRLRGRCRTRTICRAGRRVRGTTPGLHPDRQRRARLDASCHGRLMRILLLALRRLAASIPSLVIILAGLFLLLQLAPGDTVDALVAQMGGGDATMIEELRRYYGLDATVPVQLGRYMWRLVRLDLGFSAIYGKPVATVIIERLP